MSTPIHLRSPAPSPRREIIPSPILGVVIFIVTEVMFFSALLSAYLIIKAGISDWPPADQPRLPVETTAINSLILLSSAVALYFARRAREADYEQKTAQRLHLAIVLGSIFLSLQGYEWVRLIRYGLTMFSSTYGSFFYLIIGTHGLHVVVALCALVAAALRLRRGALDEHVFTAVQIFWYFVVGLWPLIYVMVYLM